MSELNIKVRKSQDNGSTFRATPDTLYMGGVGSAKVDTLHFEVPEEWAGCAITLHVQRLSGALPDPQMLDENNCVVVDRRWTQEKQGSWMLLAVDENGYIAMTKPGKYTCYETIDTNSTTETITPSVYEQFVALVKKMGTGSGGRCKGGKGIGRTCCGQRLRLCRFRSRSRPERECCGGKCHSGLRLGQRSGASQKRRRRRRRPTPRTARMRRRQRLKRLRPAKRQPPRPKKKADASKTAAARSEANSRRTKMLLPRRRATPLTAPPPLPVPQPQPPGARVLRREVPRKRPGVRRSGGQRWFR